MKKNKRFLQQDYHKKPGLKSKWKRPKGIQSKMRLKKRGYRRSVSKGYKTAKKERGLYKGLKIITVHSLKDLGKIKDGAIISKNIGLKKKLEILKNAEKEKIKVLNIDVEKFLKEAEELLKIKREKKEKREKEKVKKKEEKEKTAKEKEKTLEKEVEKSEEEIKKEKKKEKDKALTKKGS